jgi:phosphatidylserine decarboxylase
MNYVLGTAPEFNTTEMVGFPINAILDFPMITRAGLAAFASDKINAMFREVLSDWKAFLDGPDSRSVLNEGPTGWLSSEAQKTVNLREFVTKPSEPYYGFKSWNDFFIREFKQGMRPVASPNDDRIIVSACESQPFAIDTHAQQRSTFWIKEQPYSLDHMLCGRHVSNFIGGTVYQAFLSATNYHRWHSPVSGTIREIHQVPGTYYAEAASGGFDEAGPNNSQGYIAHVATRATIFIEADRAEIGLIAFVPIGMAEVSSCKVTVGEGQHVTKGDQIGYFQFGGSTHCLVFRKGVIGQFSSGAIPQGPEGVHSAIVKVNSYLATSS